MEKLCADDKVKKIHDALNDFARKVEKEHGVVINDVSFQWAHTIDGKSALVGSDINTSGKA